MEAQSEGKMKELSAIQESMANAVGAAFSPAEHENLRVVIRLTVEFRKSVEGKKLDNYGAASVFSGIDSFTSLVHAYGTLAGSDARSQLQWKAATESALKREFQAIYAKFIAEKTFEKQCRLLLDLFKLQIALAAMTYDCEQDKASLMGGSNSRSKKKAETR